MVVAHVTYAHIVGNQEIVIYGHRLIHNANQVQYHILEHNKGENHMYFEVFYKKEGPVITKFSGSNKELKELLKHCSLKQEE